MKLLLSVFLLIGFSVCCKSQSNKQNGDAAFDFFDITFYSSTCNGTCPDLTMSINSQGKVQLIRDIYKSKGVVDSTKSGAFNGEISKKDFDKLLSLIKEINWDRLDWPKVMCCDLPVKTVMVGVNGRSKNYKSMKWPQEADNLIDFLTKLASSVNLPAYDGAMDFEFMKD